MEERKDYGKNSDVKKYFTSAVDDNNVPSTSSGTSISTSSGTTVVELVETTGSTATF